MTTYCNGNDDTMVGLETGERNARECSVCGRPSSLTTFYGTICCTACKKFFNRPSIQQYLPPCQNDSNCDVAKVKCRHCRYQKCLRVGMVNKVVNRKTAEMGDHCIDRLKPAEQAFKKLWDSCRPLPAAYTTKHQTLDEILLGKHNLLTIADQFPEEPVGWDKAQFLYEIETNGLLSEHALHKQAVKDWFLMVELAKTLAFFKQLNLDDQICQISHVGMSVNFVFNAYYAHAIGDKCVTRKNGMPMTAFLEAKQINGDQKIRSIVMQSSCQLVQLMSEAGLDYDEFIHILILFLSNSTADGLSANGRELLYNESIQYSKALHKLLQFKFGLFGGTQKFAALMNVLNFAIRCKYNFEQMLFYIEIFYTRNVMTPKMMQSEITDFKGIY